MASETLDDLLPERADREAFARAVAEFNRRAFFECHDTLEEVWQGLRGPGRDLLQGLIQVAVAFYHLTNGNAEGARSLFGRAQKRLSRYPDSCYGLDLAALRGTIDHWRARAEGGPPLAEGEPLPTWSVRGVADPA